MWRAAANSLDRKKTSLIRRGWGTMAEPVARVLLSLFLLYLVHPTGGQQGCSISNRGCFTGAVPAGWVPGWVEKYLLHSVDCLQGQLFFIYT